MPHPLRSPCRGFEGLGEVLCFVDDLAIAKLHDAHGLKRLIFVIDHVLGHPEIGGSSYATDAKAARFARVMPAQRL